ncbi:MAG: putative lipid II flippase FtsW [Desulfitobacterium hafniense]|nr:putative lipid II flippase FtsW [Desulfitobacterium hafniense]
MDFPLLFLTISILAYGLIMVLSAGSVYGFNATQNSYYYVLQQLKWTAVGGLFALITYKIPYHTWRRLAGLSVVVTIGLLAAVHFTEAGIVSKGSARWLAIGPVNIQPSEAAKLAIVLFLAHNLDRAPVKRIKDIWIPLVFIGLIVGLVFKQPDLGTTMVLVFTTAALLWQTELSTKLFAIGIPLMSIPVIYLIRNTPYQWNRIVIWQNPWLDASNMGYQITNAQIAFGSGGIFGVGLGRSLQKYGFLPESHTDMIFAMVGEELGLLGALILIILFILFVARGFSIARDCPDRFGRLLAFGLTATLGFQAVCNLAVVTGVFPVTGITLPLVSYGGSSLSVTLAEIGLLLNISRFRNTAIVQREQVQSGVTV